MNDASPERQDKFRRYRASKRAKGLREVRMWVPDINVPGFREEALRQAALLDASADEREAAWLMQELAADAWRRKD